MTPRYWTGLAALIALAIVFAAVFPRYEIRTGDGVVFRVDRWRGHVEVSNAPQAGGWFTRVLAPTGQARPDDVLEVESPAPTAR